MIINLILKLWNRKVLNSPFRTFLKFFENSKKQHSMLNIMNKSLVQANCSKVIVSCSVFLEARDLLHRNRPEINSNDSKWTQAITMTSNDPNGYVFLGKTGIFRVKKFLPASKTFGLYNASASNFADVENLKRFECREIKISNVKLNWKWLKL